MRLLKAVSPIAGMPDAPNGFGAHHVPVASITAQRRVPAPVALIVRTTNGTSARSAIRDLVDPATGDSDDATVQMKAFPNPWQFGERSKIPVV